jgi:hypothetical protein
MTTATEPAAQLICLECDRLLEACAFCDQEGCPSPSCYTCMAVDLHQALKQPHEHGG